MAHLAAGVVSRPGLASVSADAAALLLVVVGLPLAILAVGAPLALVIKLLLMLIARF